jgi:hypothetical protein
MSTRVRVAAKITSEIFVSWVRQLEFLSWGLSINFGTKQLTDIEKFKVVKLSTMVNFGFDP